MPTFNLKIPTDEQTRINFAFIKKLWGPGGEAVKEKLLGLPNQDALRAELDTEFHFKIPNHVKIIVVDIEGAKTETFKAFIDIEKDEFYYLVLPPKPIKSADPDYIAMQTGLEAFFHAANDGYGM